MAQMVTIYVRGVYLPGFELIPSLAMLGMAAAVIARRGMDDEDDDDDAEWRESAPGLWNNKPIVTYTPQIKGFIDDTVIYVLQLHRQTGW